MRCLGSQFSAPPQLLPSMSPKPGPLFAPTLAATALPAPLLTGPLSVSEKRATVPCTIPECKCQGFNFIPSYPEEVGEFWLRRRTGFDPTTWRAKCRCKHTHEEHVETGARACTMRGGYGYACELLLQRGSRSGRRACASHALTQPEHGRHEASEGEERHPPLLKGLLMKQAFEGELFVSKSFLRGTHQY